MKAEKIKLSGQQALACTVEQQSFVAAAAHNDLRAAVSTCRDLLQANRPAMWRRKLAPFLVKAPEALPFGPSIYFATASDVGRVLSPKEMQEETRYLGYLCATVAAFQQRGFPHPRASEVHALKEYLLHATSQQDTRAVADFGEVLARRCKLASTLQVARRKALEYEILRKSTNALIFVAVLVAAEYLLGSQGKFVGVLPLLGVAVAFYVFVYSSKSYRQVCELTDTVVQVQVEMQAASLDVEAIKGYLAKHA